MTKLLAGGPGGQHDTDDEPLGPFGQVVQVHHGDLLLGGVDGAKRGGR
ncbi:hypothetical protein AB0B40_26790 [Streptomyces sp. NPDC042638]